MRFQAEPIYIELYWQKVHSIRMRLLRHLHNVALHVQIRQLRPRILGPSVNEPPRDGEDQHSD